MKRYTFLGLIFLALLSLGLFFKLGLSKAFSGYVPFANRGMPLYYWEPRVHHDFSNFGDAISEKVVEKIVGHHLITTFNKFLLRDCGKNKLLALGSIIHMAEEGDVIWGAGINGKHLDGEDSQVYRFKNLDVRAVRGPLTRKFLLDMDIDCPKIYGDPALLLPRLFPELKKKKNPSLEYIIIPHCDHESFFSQDSHVVSVKEDWDYIIHMILDSKLVIATAMHGLIVAEAFGVPARYLKVSDSEPLFKYRDYYLGTGRPDFKYALTVDEALKMGGEPRLICDLNALMKAFPYDLFPNAKPF